jgi:hypothetical protein
MQVLFLGGVEVHEAERWSYVIYVHGIVLK